MAIGQGRYKQKPSSEHKYADRKEDYLRGGNISAGAQRIAGNVIAQGGWLTTLADYHCHVQPCCYSSVFTANRRADRSGQDNAAEASSAHHGYIKPGCVGNGPCGAFPSKGCGKLSEPTPCGINAHGGRLSNHRGSVASRWIRH